MLNVFTTDGLDNNSAIDCSGVQIPAFSNLKIDLLIKVKALNNSNSSSFASA